MDLEIKEFMALNIESKLGYRCCSGTRKIDKCCQFSKKEWHCLIFCLGLARSWRMFDIPTLRLQASRNTLIGMISQQDLSKKKQMGGGGVSRL